MYNLVCIGGPLDGQLRAVDHHMLEAGTVRFAKPPSTSAMSFRPTKAADINKPVAIQVYDYKVDTVRLRTRGENYEMVQYLRYEPDFDVCGAIVHLLVHYQRTAGNLK